MCISMKYVKLQRVIKGIFILCNEIYQELVRGGGEGIKLTEIKVA